PPWGTDNARLIFMRGDSMAAVKKKARKPSAAFMKPMTPSAALATVIGSKAMPRTEVTKKLWAYITKNRLPDAKIGRMISADDDLKTLLGGKKQVSMFDMAKLVSKHLKEAIPGLSMPRGPAAVRPLPLIAGSMRFLLSALLGAAAAPIPGFAQ